MLTTSDDHITASARLPTTRGLHVERRGEGGDPLRVPRSTASGVARSAYGSG